MLRVFVSGWPAVAIALLYFIRILQWNSMLLKCSHFSQNLEIFQFWLQRLHGVDLLMG